jgi:two-component system, response regulator
LRHKNHTVLLVEDDPDDVLMVIEALADMPSIKLVHEKNGFEALAYLKELRAKAAPLPCLIVLDMNMPILNGKQLLSILKNGEDFNSIPAIVFTTSSNEKDKDFCNQFDVPLITKPYDINTFNKTVQKFVDHCKAA